MKKFMDADFLLCTQTARRLYHDHAAKMPIIDYHCHIDPREIYEDRVFENITQVWLGGDHYKWRIMRACGIDEYYITGDAPDREKFQKFAQCLSRCIGNPMYHWCHLELKTYFGYEGILSEDTAQEVWDLCEKKLPQLSARTLIQNSNVAMIGTTDDPCSDLCWHKKLAQSDFGTKVCPSFRPDPALNIHKAGWRDYMGRLSGAAGVEIRSAADVKKALTARIEYFDAAGCRASDHGLDYVMYRSAEDAQLEAIFQKAMAGNPVTVEETEMFQTAMLLHCGAQYARLGWVMQLHFNCKRNPNSRAFATLGPDTGFDSMAASCNCDALYSLMDAWERENSLPKTVLYSLNPADNAWVATLIGAFQGTTCPGKIQQGSAWWFNDNKTGMTEQLTSLANVGVLGNFIGMLTDSRSLLSYTRHEYFRRVLCDLLGTWAENGEYPDGPGLAQLVEDISYNNAKRYFDL